MCLAEIKLIYAIKENESLEESDEFFQKKDNNLFT